jgi:AraC-like DNA-binding protein
VTRQETVGTTVTRTWTTTRTLSDVFAVCSDQRAIGVLAEPNLFSYTHRVARLGPVTICDIAFGCDVWMDCAELCDSYRINVPQSGRIHSVHRGSSMTAEPTVAAVYQPVGESAVSRWAGRGRTISVKMDRRVVDDALSDALGRPVTSHIDFSHAMPITAGTARSWAEMLLFLADDLFRGDSMLDYPLVGMPLVDSLVRGLLVAADHPHRSTIAGKAKSAAPRYVRAALEIIEAEPHLPLTVSSLARRSHTSARALQEGFRRHLDMSPIAYLRDVRLRRAHQTLLESDPSIVTVASVANQWGFTNLGRFAAVHAARYGETPVVTLRRSYFGRY